MDVLDKITLPNQRSLLMLKRIFKGIGIGFLSLILLALIVYAFLPIEERK